MATSTTASEDVEILVAIIHVLCERIVFTARRVPLSLTLPAAGKKSAGERAPWDQAHALLEAKRDHLPLLFAVHEVQVVLHGGEAVIAVDVGEEQHRRELPSRHAARAQIAHFAGTHERVERLESFFHRSVMVEAVDLIEIDVVMAEPLQRSVASRENVLAGKAAAIGTFGEREEALRGKNIVLAVRELFENLARHFFTDTFRVHIRGVKKVEAELERTLDVRASLVFAEDPRPPIRVTVGHAAKTESRDL